MNMKKSIAFLLSAVTLLSLLSGCGGKTGSGSDKDGNTLKVSMWMPKGEDSSFYKSYEENPVVKYLETLDFNGRKLDLSFLVPITGAELDNFNTLLMTDEYADVMDMAYSTTSAAQLYEDGYIWDLTPYIDQYMPNYKAVLETYPQLDPYLYSLVDGEQKMLSISHISAVPGTTFKGFLYRRDWIVKYGANPQTGAAFTSGYTNPDDYNTYYDDVVFPSGETDPMYISDWEWMFEIFTRAMADLGITDGYCYAPYYVGYGEDGTLNDAFGGGTAMWYRQNDGTMAFGGGSDHMHAYLQCMNNWYEKGWLDKNFAEHSSDSAWTIDTAKVHMGKIGLWVGRAAESGGEMDLGDELTSGIMVFGARAPINDIYGSESDKNVVPFSVFQHSQISGSMVITKKISEEDLPTLLTFIDFLYTEEGGKLIQMGLNKEEFETIQDETYIKYGLTDGTHWMETQPDGSKTYGYYDCYNEQYSYILAFAGRRIHLGYTTKPVSDGSKNPFEVIANHARDEWECYPNTGFPDRGIRIQFTEDESNAYSKVYANVTTCMSSTVPKFITGDLDIDSTSDWENYCKMLNKYSPDKVTAIYQRVYDAFK